VQLEWLAEGEYFGTGHLTLLAAADPITLHICAQMLSAYESATDTDLLVDFPSS
jgi:hypothetical protein